jgi:fructokinase
MRIGIDLGGTKIEGIAMTSSGEIACRYRVRTPAGDYEATLAAIADVVRHIEQQGHCAGAPIGFATPGAPSRATGLMKNCNSTCLNGRPLHADLERLLQRPVRLANDANCFALSEASDGAAAGARVVFGVILGTGVGGGIVIDGQVLDGVNSIAGEWGHNPLPAPQPGESPGPACYCGRRGCIETWLSGPGFARDAGAPDAAEVMRSARAGEEAARAAFERYVDRLARALGSIVNVLDPDVVVLGGGVSNVQELYTAVPAALPQYVFSDEVRTRIVPPRHGDSSGVRGAAWLWPTPPASSRQ